MKLNQQVIYRGEKFNGVTEHAALVTRVWGPAMVNLAVFPDASGYMTRTSVPLHASRAAADEYTAQHKAANPGSPPQHLCFIEE
jgi:hypothetical protein